MSEKIYVNIHNQKEEAKGEILAQILKDRAEYENALNLEKAEAEAKANARESALAKLAALGLTADEVAAL